METLFTPASVMSLLTQIEELKDYDISMTETMDNQIQLQVGDSVYILESDSEVEIDVSESDLDAVEDANLSTYEDLSDEGYDNVDIDEPIESGLLKEAAKAMLLGGMIKLSAKMLGK